MPILMTAEVRGQTPEGYDGVLAVVAEAARKSPGFVMHTSFPVEGGWRVMEVWQSKADSDRFFVEQVVPYLPPGIHPKRATQELHSLVLP